MTQQTSGAPALRVQELLALYGARSASAAELLCDRHDPARIAYHVVSPDMSVRSLTYGELRQESERVAASLAALGVRPGDRVATLMGKSRRYLVTLMAIWRLGAVHVPLFTAFAAPAVAQRLRASAAVMIICDGAQRCKVTPGEPNAADAALRVVTTGPLADGDMGFHALLESTAPCPAPAALGGNAPLIHIFTSGTTGTSKGVVVPLSAVAGFQIYAEYGLGIRPEDRFWNAADPGWAYGLYFGVVASFATGVESFLFEGGFSPETTLGMLRGFKITNFAAAPTVYRSLRGSGLATTGLSLRSASSAGEPLTSDVNEWAVKALGVMVRDHYGQTETGMLINNHHHPDLDRPLKAGSMGHPMPGWSAAVLKIDADEPAPHGEVGRVAIDLAASPLAWFRGYADDSAKSAEKFSADGRWYLTGDIGYVDESGDFYFSARDDDVIIMAGYRIGPGEVESIILTHPAISECAVVAVPDAVRGEVLEAVVVLAEGWTPSVELSEALQTKVKREFAAHAYPRRVHYLDALPRTASGKVQRFVLRQLLRGSPSRSPT
ncbi:MAG TPA: AMP-binding protein [Acetobacteraceae bacterium]|nr:AMP-binding protein [Acetobacteraceae bacterium]